MNFLMLQRDNEISAKVTSCHYKYLTEPDLCNTNDIGMCDMWHWQLKCQAYKDVSIVPPKKILQERGDYIDITRNSFFGHGQVLGVIVSSFRNTYFLNIWINIFSNSKRSNFPRLFERIQSPCLKEQFAIPRLNPRWNSLCC